MACSAEVIELNLEPVIDFFMESMIFVTNLFGSYFFFQGFYFGCGSILICTTNEEGVVASHSTVPSVCVS